MRALIGYSGFVGGNLRNQGAFDAWYRSSNIDEIRGSSFEEIVCAATPAEKWKANADQEADRRAITRLTSALEQARCERFILISTVDVYPTPKGVDESTPINPDSCAPYGRHRLLFEDWVREHFSTVILRLPALFGPGLKKNAVYDLLHDNQVEKIDGRGVFQFYSVERLGEDIRRTIAAGIDLLNVATEPVAIQEIATRFFNRSLAAGTNAAPSYDFRSRHAAAFGGSDGYLYRRDEVLQDLGTFIERSR